MSDQTEKMVQADLNKINTWYARSRPRFIDLVGDYAGKELFLLEGDSLLRECFSDDRIDFHYGFQMLHAVFVVERFLENLTRRHCRFHVAFIDEHNTLCVPDRASKNDRPRYLLARSVIIRHLQRYLPKSSGVQIHVFQSLHDEAFDQYISMSRFHFVMAHDGSPPAAGRVRIKTETPRLYLRGNIWWFNSHKLSVALINRVEFKDSKVFTMILEGWDATRQAHPLQKLISSTRELGLDLEQNTTREFERQSKKFCFDTYEWLSKEAIQKILTGRNMSAPENWVLTICSLSVMICEGSDTTLCSIFLLHVLLIRRLLMSQRRLPLIKFERGLVCDNDWGGDSEAESESDSSSGGYFESDVAEFLAMFAEIAEKFLADKGWAEVMALNVVKPGLADLVDGRLFRALLQASFERSLVSDLPPVIQDDWSLVLGILFAICGKTLSLNQVQGRLQTHARTHARTHASRTQLGKAVGELSIMPFSNPIFNEHLACIRITADTALPAQLAPTELYREITHWHNRKPLITKQTAQSIVSKWKNPYRLNQFYMAEMIAYAASLTGAKGKVLEPETITVGAKKHVKTLVDGQKAAGGSSSPTKGAKEERSAKQGKGLSKSTAPVLTSAQKIIADNIARKAGGEYERAFKAWTQVMRDYNKISNFEERYLRAKAYLDGLDSAKSAPIEADVNLYLLQALLAWWAEYRNAGNGAGGYHVVALIWALVRTTYSSKALTKEIALHLEKICKLLSITNAISTMGTTLQDRKPSFEFSYPLNSQALKINLPQVEFQLLHVGPYMDRFLDAKPDPRVSSFIPDGWQRKVLDELDANNSVFVVAPTSAGKTFISFYAMEQVLRADNDSVLVYVAPTKALVNQIAAEVQGRFSKRFPQAGKCVWAIHTRDHRVNSSVGCQILVTVPHILQIMLLAPTNANAWAPRVRRIIFDEIHSIGQAEDGIIWEQLLLLAPCPIIALSATVGNPTEFSEWLAETQKASGTKLTMIQHSTRYSDLRKYIYEPPLTFKFDGLGKSSGVGLGLDGLPGLKFFHPVASLIDRSRGMPDDLALEPRDCFLLWKAMCKHQNQANGYKMPSNLDPSKALPPCIKKTDVLKWERDLKEVLLRWANTDSRKSPFDNVVQELGPRLLSEKIHGKIFIADEADAMAAVDEDAEINANDLRTTTLPLLYQLHQRHSLPAILFNYDRSGCEVIAETLLNQLKAAENRRKGGKEWQRKLDEWAKWKELKAKQEAKKSAKKARRKGDDKDDEKLSKADLAREDTSAELSSFDLFDPDEPLDDFSFADPKRCAKTELDVFFSQLRRKRINEVLIELLQRGIGVHHSGMNRKYRQCVEMLFRKAFLRVVIATGTLSLGINMPCATVVFCGDSVYLTALNFRQASGRAGRRGFDLLGNVVFQAITRERACRLLSSRLPDLTGHFPITTTLVLRLFTLLHNSKNSPYAVKAINSLLSQPRLYLGGESFKEQVLHHLRFSIDYLRRQSLLGPGGEPINFTSCVSHLYFTENSSFAFHALLKDGYFKKLCAGIDKSTDQVLQTMMLVLSHIFGRKLCKEAEDEETAAMIRRSPSMVYLPPMPEQARAILRQHNENTLSIFATYVKTFAQQHVRGEDRELPLTNILVGGQQSLGTYISSPSEPDGHSPEIASPDSEAPMPLAFLPTLPVPDARSAFVALSGHGDDFANVMDLCTSVRSGIFLESAVIPFLEIHPDESRTPLNAYLLDFFIHGTLKPLVVANRIRKSDVWFDLNDFSLVLATIVTSLAGYLDLGKGDVDDEILEVMGTGDLAETAVDEEMAETFGIHAPGATQAVLSNSGIGDKKWKRVAEDWDKAEDMIAAQQQMDKDEEDRAVLLGADDDKYRKMLNVYRAFKMLKTEYDAKFRKIWA